VVEFKHGNKTTGSQAWEGAILSPRGLLQSPETSHWEHGFELVAAGVRRLLGIGIWPPRRPFPYAPDNEFA
jgi:hypothetical protein